MHCKKFSFPSIYRSKWLPVVSNSQTNNLLAYKCIPYFIKLVRNHFILRVNILLYTVESFFPNLCFWCHNISSNNTFSGYIWNYNIIYNLPHYWFFIAWTLCILEIFLSLGCLSHPLLFKKVNMPVNICPAKYIGYVEFASHYE